MMKVFTIINDNKLVGIIKLQENVVSLIESSDVLLLTQEINKGDSRIITLQLSLMKMRKDE